MKGSILRAATVGAMGVIAVAQAPTPASAALIADGVTYQLETQATANPLTRLFALKITGENTLSDTEGGRTGINAIAFQQPTTGTVTGGTMISPSGFTFHTGGLNSSGCDGAGNFYCFDNGAIPPTPTTALSGTLIYVFSATLAAGGSWTGYNPDFKIDWVGTKNNYDLVSLSIGGVTPTCPDCGINPVIIDAPEPATLAILGMGLIGLGAVRQRRCA